PQLGRLVQQLDDAARAPQHERVAGDLLAGLARRAVVLEVDAGRGAIVLARGVDRLLVAEAALVFGQRFGLDVRDARGAPCAQLPAQVEPRVAADHRLGQRRRL